MSKRVSLLLSILIISSIIPSVYADENSEQILLETNKVEYFTGDKLVISGVVLEKKMPVIALRIYDPDGDIISANNVEIDDDDTFSKTIFLDEPFYEKTGTYNALFDYGKEKSQIDFNILDKNFNEQEIIEQIIIPPEIVILVSDKDEYVNNDYVVINGLVSEKSEPNVLVGIYDKFGFPTGFYFGEIDENLEFSVTFLVKDGVNFKTFGTYSAIAYYGDYEELVEFDYVEIQQIEEEPKIIDKPTIETEQQNEIIIETQEPTIDDEPIIIDEPETTEIIPKENNVDEKKAIEVSVPSKINEESNQKQLSQKEITEKSVKPIKENNLSVKDIALGIMLNQITLSCDKDDYADSISYYDGMGPALMRLCNFPEAINHFDLALIDDPQNIEVLTNKGSALSKLGLYDEAITFFDYALEINPKFLPAINNKANALINLGNFEDGIINYNLALELDPNFSLAKKNLNLAQKEFPKNLQFTIFDEEKQSFDSVTQITNQVADTTVDTFNEINENPSNVLKQIGVVFSMIGSSFFNFLN